MQSCVVRPGRAMHKGEVNYRGYEVLLRCNKTEHTGNSWAPEKAAHCEVKGDRIAAVKVKVEAVK